MSPIITSLQNAQVKHTVSLHSGKGRKKYGEFLIEGKRFVREAFLRQAEVIKLYYCLENQRANQQSIADLLQLAEKEAIPVEEVSPAVMRKMSAAEEPQGILGLVKIPEYDWSDISLDHRSILLIIDGIRDPGNLGTILRTALAANVKNIILTRGTADIYNPKVLRSTMGAIFALTILTDKTPQEITDFCKGNNCFLAVSDMNGTSVFSERISEQYPLALIVGNEAVGVSEYFLQSADKVLAIPMFNRVESLNAAISAGIILFEIRRQLGFL